MGNAQNKVAIAGVGYSKVGRHLPLPDDELVRQAVTAAMEDGGMKPSDIDGIATMGGNAMSIGGLLGIMPLEFSTPPPGVRPSSKPRSPRSQPWPRACPIPVWPFA